MDRAVSENVETERRYIIHRRWMILFLISVCTLLLISVPGFILQLRRVAPDFLGTMAGMIRDSPFVGLGAAGGNFADSVLDGSEAVRKYGHLKVFIGDVKPAEEVGKVALVGVEEARREGWTKVKLGRGYE